LNISQERERGFREGLGELQMPFREEYLVHCEMEPDSATAATRRLLKLPEPPDAIYGINDTVAFAAMKEIRKQGLRIPEDVGIVGFTDDYHATVVHPPLTSVSHPTFEMGETAARLFFESLEGKPPRQVELKTRLVTRESSRRR
jgi:LacI family transcriptional regulator